MPVKTIQNPIFSLNVLRDFPSKLYVWLSTTHNSISCFKQNSQKVYSVILLCFKRINLVMFFITKAVKWNESRTGEIFFLIKKYINIDFCTKNSFSTSLIDRWKSQSMT